MRIKRILAALLALALCLSFAACVGMTEAQVDALLARIVE